MDTSSNTPPRGRSSPNMTDNACPFDGRTVRTRKLKLANTRIVPNTFVFGTYKPAGGSHTCREGGRRMDLGRIAAKWRLIQGSNYWEGLLDPLDPDLRRTILICGDHSQATYDAFNSERRSKYAGSSRYGKTNFFSKVGLTLRWPYEVSKFIYATSTLNIPEFFIVRSFSRKAWSRESNWMGFVAATSDSGKSRLGRRDITIAWRGSVRSLEWMDDLELRQASISSLLSPHRADLDVKLAHLITDEARVQSGWFDVYTSPDPRSWFNTSSAREQVLRELRRVIELYKDDEISITTTGHSLGAALATLCATDIVINGINKVPDRSPIPVTAIVFASPRVGNHAFREVVDRLSDLRVLRVTNNPDLVPLYPLLGYEDVGVELRIDTGKSPYVKNPGNAREWHNLEAYLHALAGTQGKDQPFRLAIDRDIALVNKWSDFLKEEYNVPAFWWVEKNKGMVLGKDGRWRMAEPPLRDG